MAARQRTGVRRWPEGPRAPDGTIDGNALAVDRHYAVFVRLLDGQERALLDLESLAPVFDALSKAGADVPKGGRR